MRRLSPLCWMLAVLWLLPCAAALAHHHHDGKLRGLADTTVLIVRHAEKPAHGTGLAPAGQARAQAYVRYFESFAVDGQPLRPDTLVATADSRHSDRPELTLQPLAQALGLPIDDRFDDQQVKELADMLEQQPHGSVVLICWHHGEVPKLVHALGGDPSALLPHGKWPSKVFGWVLVLRYDHQGYLASAQRIDEHLMPDDR